MPLFVTAEQQVTVYLHTAVDLAGRWRQMDNDPAFLSWLDGIDKLTMKKRAELLRGMFEADDAIGAAALYREYIREQLVLSGEATYTYNPTAGDMAKLRVCLDTFAPDDVATNCLIPAVAQTLMNLTKEVDAAPDHPSQTYEMIKVAEIRCGLPSGVQHDVPPQTASCLAVETQNVTVAIVVAMRDADVDKP
jgi:hypothetical protein